MKHSLSDFLMFVFPDSTMLTVFHSKSGVSENDRLNGGYSVLDLPLAAISEVQANRICVKSCLVCGLEDFDFPDSKPIRTRKKAD
jgi:hypothetical protein